jgi:DNA polymerase-3 subunit alpha
MLSKFADIPTAISNTVEIAKRCNVTLTLGKYFLPDFALPAGVSIDGYLKEISVKGLESRFLTMFPDGVSDTNRVIYSDRLNLELVTIVEMGFSGYFLIVADFINWAKSNDVPVGPGRGSGAGSLVAFALGITDLEPLRYGLLFERFLNPERVSMPDFDIDFCQDKRELVIEYVKNKYGAAAVSQIATFGTMSSKAVIKDVGRVLGLPYGLCDSISKLILNTPAKSYGLLEALDKFDDLKARIDNADDEVKRLWEMSLQLEDIARNVGKHAAGVLIAPSQLTDFCPLYVADGMQTSQLDKDDVEYVGLVKFDFLGLRNLTIIKETLDNINHLYQQQVSLSQYDFDDSATYKLLQDGNTSGVFQLESPGMRRILVKLSPDRFEDIIALLALYRPGPLGSGMVDDFINCKKGIKEPNYFHPDLKPVLESTYGVIVYQEQVMQISQIIGGYTLGSADLLRRAMGKKKPEEMAKHKNIFIDGALKRGYQERLAIELFDLMAKFAEYGFNKSHSAAYAVVSYHTAFLKTHYLSCFMAATLSSELHNTDKLYEFFIDCKNNSLSVLPPDINLSDYKFKAVADKEIRYGLGAIKGIGSHVVEAIVVNRTENGPFKGFIDFCERLDKKVINKKSLEGLVKSGAFDCFDTNRAKYFNAIPDVLSGASRVYDENQGSLFEEELTLPTVTQEEYVENLPDVTNWDLKQKLQMEKEAFGYYFSASLFDHYHDIIARLHIAPLNRYSLDNEDMQMIVHSRSRDKEQVLVCGVINRIGSKLLKRGGKVYFITIEDNLTQFEFVIFGDEYEKYKTLLKADELVFVLGELIYDSFREQIKVTAKQIYSLDDVLVDKIQEITLNLTNSSNLEDIKPLISAAGSAAILVNYANEYASCRVKFGDKHKFMVNYAHLNQLSVVLGRDGWMVNIYE